MQNYYGLFCDGVVDTIWITSDSPASCPRPICIQCSEMRIASNEINTVLDCVADSQGSVWIVFKNICGDRNNVGEGLRCIPKPHILDLFLERLPGS